MKLIDAENKPLTARYYLERYVNDGSPSGFTDLYRTSPLTDPFGLRSRFHLPICTAAEDLFVSYGDIPTWPYPTSTGWIFLHPDMEESIKSISKRIEVSLFEDAEVTPTASSRTVQFVGGQYHDYVKLHYDGIIGRVNRSLPYHKAVAGPEICGEVLTALDTGILPESTSVLPEVGATVLRVPPKKRGSEPKEVGMVWRTNMPHGRNAERICHLWPLFSLFSTDRLSPLDDCLLKQIIDARREPPDEFALNRLIYPIIDSYFHFVLKLGYQIECNAQNLMVGLDDDFNVVSIVIRDIGRFEKDITIRKSLGLPTKYESYPYKCIAKGDELYEIRHSFAFDFKLAYYIIAPVLNLICNEYDQSLSGIEEEIRKYMVRFLELLPSDYFPNDGKWYKHERILLVKNRPYVGMLHPKYR